MKYKVILIIIQVVMGINSRIILHYKFFSQVSKSALSPNRSQV